MSRRRLDKLYFFLEVVGYSFLFLSIGYLITFLIYDVFSLSNDKIKNFININQYMSFYRLGRTLLTIDATFTSFSLIFIGTYLYHGYQDNQFTTQQKLYLSSLKETFLSNFLCDNSNVKKFINYIFAKSLSHRVYMMVLFTIYEIILYIRSDFILLGIIFFLNIYYVLESIYSVFHYVSFNEIDLREVYRRVYLKTDQYKKIVISKKKKQKKLNKYLLSIEPTIKDINESSYFALDRSIKSEKESVFLKKIVEEFDLFLKTILYEYRYLNEEMMLFLIKNVLHKDLEPKEKVERISYILEVQNQNEEIRLLPSVLSYISEHFTSQNYILYFYNYDFARFLNTQQFVLLMRFLKENNYGLYRKNFKYIVKSLFRFRRSGII